MEEEKHRLEKFHPQLEGKHVLFVDKSMLTPGYVSHMQGLERMNVTQLDNLQQTSGLIEFMDDNEIDFAIIHNYTPSEVGEIIAAVQSGKVIVVQEKDPAIRDNQDLNRQIREGGVKSFPRAEPDHVKAFNKCLDYLAKRVKEEDK